MNAETKIVTESSDCLPVGGEALSYIRKGLGKLDVLAERRDALHRVFEDLARSCDRPTAKQARKLAQKLAAVEPGVTVIGQVKAGKTSLVNAMVGMPGLLPADVNPWTSVVTSLHLDPEQSPAQNSASFSFFDRNEWDRLVIGGGRVGELARRAGADSEVERVRQQVEEMREKSKKRLGRKFELLLGQEHEYGYFDGELIERYVCLGDDFENDTETSKSRGRFADITKSARIAMHAPASPVRLCIRDTPGVNDTFLVREQITIRAIRGSRVCVVVLAAHQALSSVDMALIRLISNVQSREVVIFVNRIDELSDPASQVPEIRASIEATLAAHQGPSDATIIFGSAQWANQVLEGRLTDIGDEGAESLLNYARFELPRIPAGGSAQETIWELSGMAALHRVLAERIADGPGKEGFDDIARSARNLLNGIEIATTATARDADGDGNAEPVDRDKAIQDFYRIEKESLRSLEDGLTRLCDDFGTRIDRVHDSFLERATGSLIEHLDRRGSESVWTYDPTGLRLLLRSSYMTFAKRSRDLINQVLSATAADSATFFEHAFAIGAPGFSMEPPKAPTSPAPVILGQTIALDLQTNWWASWWRRQTGAASHAKEFSEMIAAETAPMLEGLREQNAVSIRDDAAAVLTEFLLEQKRVLDDLLTRADAPDGQTGAMQGFTDPDRQRAAIKAAYEVLDTLFG